MTTIDNPNGPGDSLLFLWSNADAKGACGSMYRLDPDGRGGYTRHEDVRLAPVVQEELGVYPSFILGSYSYVQPVRNPVTRHINHLVGLYVQLQHGKHSYPTWSDKKIYMGGLFAIRDEKGRYTINEVNGRHNGSDTPLTAVRAIEPSPFRNDTDVYFGGHDCAFRRSTDFAWMYKAPLRTVLGLPLAKTPVARVPKTPVPPASKAPVPSPVEQQKAVTHLGEIYDFAKAQTDEQKRELIEVLLGAARETNEPAETFALLRKAMELARDAGDAVLMCEIIDRIADSFQIDPLVIQGKMLQSVAAKATTAARIESLVRASNAYIDRAVAQKRFDYAESIASLAYRTSQTAAGKQFREKTLDRFSEVRRLRADHEKNK